MRIRLSERRIMHAWAVVAAVATCGPALALSTDRAANLFSADEGIVLKTTAWGTAEWQLSNDYGERIAGSSAVVDGRIVISTVGLRFGRYTFEVAGDGKLVGGLVPPLLNIPPDLSPAIFQAPAHFQNAEEGLMWQQLGIREMRYEFGFDRFNPEKGKYVFDPNIEKYFAALAEHGIRPSFKINGPPKWNDSSTVQRKRGEPKSYEDYEQTVRAFAEHYKRFGVDRYYIINEPEAGGWWSAGWDGYYRFLAATNRALKAVDPRILTIAPESWSEVPVFLSTILSNYGDSVDIISGHYPAGDLTGDVHSGYYFTEMRKAGVWRPFVNGEDQCWTSNVSAAVWNKLYPGVRGNCTGQGPGITQMVNLDLGVHRVTMLQESWNKNQLPFASYTAGQLVPADQCFQIRAVGDELAGAELVRRLDEAPTHVMGWVYRRGSDRYIGAYVAEGQLTQLMQINTLAPWLRIVDCFGNEQIAEPVDGKVMLLLSNLETFVHGLGPMDTFEFVPRRENLPPQIIDPGRPETATGVRFCYALLGRDPDANLQGKRLPAWTLLNGPEGMTIRAGSGVLDWLPNIAGDYPVTVRLDDADSGTFQRTFTVRAHPRGTNMPPRFVSRSTPVVVVGGSYRYEPKAVDPDSELVTYSVQGPVGMTFEGGVITWKAPAKPGVYSVKVMATDSRREMTEQVFELVVCANPDRPKEAMSWPRVPADLTVGAVEGERVTLVWSPQSFGQSVVQRSVSRNGPWAEVGRADTSNYINAAPAGPVFYRVFTSNSGGDSEPTPPVNGRNRVSIADAGMPVRLTAAGTAELDGSASMDPEGKPLTYRWALVNAPDGAEAKLDNSAAAKARLTIDKPGRYMLRLEVSDGEETSRPAWVRVVRPGNVMERVGYAGPTQFAKVGQRVALTGRGSAATTPKEGWFWRWHGLPLGGYVPLQGNKTKQVSFTPQIPGVYHIMCVPQDDWMNGFPEVVKVMVTP